MILNSKEIILLQRIKEDRFYKDWFFKQAQDLKWFFPLKDQGYFNPETITYNSDGNALFWIILDYLERVSEQVAKSPEFGKELLDIIEKIIQFSRNKKRINNYHIWWFCIKILNNIPNPIIKEHLFIDDSKVNGKILRITTGTDDEKRRKLLGH